MDTEDVTQAARELGDHPALRIGARVGYAVNGLLHLLLGWLALQLAIGARGTTADQSGALSTLAGSGLGRLALFVSFAGFSLLALWQATETVVLRGKGATVKSGSKAILYAALAASALSFARGSRSSSTGQTVDVTARLLGEPMGRFLVALLGLVVLGIAGYHVFKGWTKRFLRDLREHPGQWAVAAGRFGYIAKGVALFFVGLLFLIAALRENASEATGLDGALRFLLGMPFGGAPLVVIAAGLAAYGVYSFARSRYARV